METTIIRKKLHQLIDEMGDKKAEAIYTLLSEDVNNDQQRQKLILSEREKYLRGEGKSYTPLEVRKMAMEKIQRHAI